MKLTRVGIGQFRSIGEVPVVIDLTKKINVLVGANNCGKSNVLRAICSFGKKTEDELDMPNRAKGTYPVFWIHAAPTTDDPEKLRPLGEIIFGWRQTPDGEAIVGSPFKDLDWGAFMPIWNEVAPQGYHYHGWPSDSQIAGEKTKTALLLYSRAKKQLPATAFIPQFRQITAGGDYSIDGKGIIGVLSRWQHPKIGEDSNRARFTKVQNLLRTLIQAPNVSLEVDHEGQSIVVDSGNLRLPLDSYGTGIHELIILAIAVLGHEDSLVCIEEPEIHLHPLLQRRFMSFLRQETNNRYVITTHSAALISLDADIAVTHLWLENGVTKSRLVETTNHSLEVLRDLGVRASDILQANSVVWVEGPSDRIYLNHWIRLLYPDLREGIDYSIMFYGGRLLSHLSLEREDAVEVDDLINLLRINQHSAILIDSDQKNSAASINDTKKRVLSECKKSGVLCWVTEGREIENYLPASAVVAAYQKLVGQVFEYKLPKFASIEDSLIKAIGKRDWKKTWSYDNAKPQMAREIIKHITKENVGPEVPGWISKLEKVIRHRP